MQWADESLRITFLGTRGGIVARRRGHFRHSSLLVSHRGHRLLIDAGADWLGALERVGPEAIVVTHAHPDHVGGLAQGAPCSVYATAATWRSMPRFPIAARQRRILRPGRRHRIAGLTVEPFPVQHSLRAPAVGLRIAAGGARLFYVPDVLSIPHCARALRGVQLYVGDGAAILRSVVRGRGAKSIGHASIRTQLGWCVSHEVAQALFTHCGSEIVAGDERSACRRVRRLARAAGVPADLARDGSSVVVGEGARHCGSKPAASRPAARARG